MSVINVTKMWSKTGGTFSCEKTTTLRQTYAITEGYQVLAEVGDTVVTVCSANGIPSFGEQHSSGIAAYAKSINGTPMGPAFWVVTVGFEGETLNTGDDPEPIDVEWSDTTTTEPIDRDFDGAAIVTANGEPVDGLSMDVSDQIVVIRRKFLTIDTATIAAYRRATNSDEFLGWPAGTGRLIGFSAKNKFYYGGAKELWDVTARIQFREPYAGTTAGQVWYKRWRHEGLYVKEGSIVRRAVDDSGRDMTKPVLLKADGTRETDPEAAVFMYTQVYDSLPYVGLGLT